MFPIWIYFYFIPPFEFCHMGAHVYGQEKSYPKHRYHPRPNEMGDNQYTGETVPTVTHMTCILVGTITKIYAGARYFTNTSNLYFFPSTNHQAQNSTTGTRRTRRTLTKTISMTTTTSTTMTTTTTTIIWMHCTSESPTVWFHLRTELTRWDPILSILPRPWSYISTTRFLRSIVNRHLTQL